VLIKVIYECVRFDIFSYTFCILFGIAVPPPTLLEMKEKMVAKKKASHNDAFNYEFSFIA